MLYLERAVTNSRRCSWYCCHSTKQPGGGEGEGQGGGPIDHTRHKQSIRCIIFMHYMDAI